METRYLETTIVGHLTGRLLANSIATSREQLTRQWWAQCASQYELYISQLVIDESGAGATRCMAHAALYSASRTENRVVFRVARVVKSLGFCMFPKRPLSG